MKIECDKCGAKYSIADEKVRGKTFKIRCKRCSNVIIVRDKASAEDKAVEAKVGKRLGKKLVKRVRKDNKRAKKAIRRKILVYPLRSIRKMAVEANISKSAAARIVRELGVRSRARSKRQKLTDTDKEKRVARSRKLMNLLKKSKRPNVQSKTCRMTANWIVCSRNNSPCLAE